MTPTGTTEESAGMPATNANATDWADVLAELEARNATLAAAIDAEDWAAVTALGAFVPPAEFNAPLDDATRRRAIDVLAETKRLEDLLAAALAELAPPPVRPPARARRNHVDSGPTYLDRLA